MGELRFLRYGIYRRVLFARISRSHALMGWGEAPLDLLITGVAILVQALSRAVTGNDAPAQPPTLLGNGRATGPNSRGYEGLRKSHKELKYQQFQFKRLSSVLAQELRKYSARIVQACRKGLQGGPAASLHHKHYWG
jgi:hypothetical protein